MTAPAAPDASFGSVDEAMDMARAAAGLPGRGRRGVVAGRDPGPAAAGVERAGRSTPRPGRALTAFTAQGGYADDGHGGSASVAGLADPGDRQGRVRAIGWMRRLSAHPVIAGALAAGTITESYARKICDWSDLLPYAYRDEADEFLAGEAAGGLDLDGLAQLAEEMFSRVAPPDRDEEDDARFKDRFFRLTRLFQGHGKADGDLTPECLAARHRGAGHAGARRRGPEDDRSAGQRRHDALEEAMRLLLASGCLPERAGQAAQVQLHLTLDELMDMPGGTNAASAWLARHLGHRPARRQRRRRRRRQPGRRAAGHPDTSQPSAPVSPA